MRSELPFELANSDWEITTLGQLCRRGGGVIQTGPFGSQLHAHDYVDDGIPSIMPQDIIDGRIDATDIARITESDAKRLSRYRVRAGDIVCSRRGDLRRRVLIQASQDGWLCGTGCLLVRLGDGADPAYVAAFMAHPATEKWIERHAVGATMPNLNTDILSTVPIALPDPVEQQRIATLLRALDDKIDSNRRLAGLLEEAAATLFRAQFVDFAGVDEFEDSNIGRIPRGWRAGALIDLAQFVNGKAITKHANGRGRPILRIRELNSGIDDNTLRSDVDVADEHVARDRDILFAWSGSLGVHRWSGPESLINQHIFKVIPDGYPSWFVYQWICQHMAEFQAIAGEKATTMGHIQRRHLLEAAVPAPPPNAIAATADTLDPIDEQQGSLVSETRTLAALRNGLLPKLISGQIRVPDTSDPAEVIGPVAEQLAARPS